MKYLAPILVSLVTVAYVFAQAPVFTETFDGTPATPDSYTNPHNWDVYTQGFNEAEASGVLPPGVRQSTAQHGPNCEPPGFPYTDTNSHPIRSVSDTVFICNGHVMTSPGLAGYAAVYMTVPAVLDFSGGEATLRFDMSTLITSARDWPEVTLMPLDEFQGLAFNQHGTQDSIDLSADGAPTWKVRQRSNGGPNNTDEHGAALRATGLQWDTILAHHGLRPDLARRDTFELRISRTRVSVCMPTYGECIVQDVPLITNLDPAIWHDQAVVMLSHRVYNAEKACSADQYDSQSIVHSPQGDANCPPNTWHWDNVTLQPSVPFQIISPTRPFLSLYLQSGRSPAVDLAAPAPANAVLHFVSFGDPSSLQVSADGGATWLTPTPRGIAAGTAHSELGDYYTAPVPAGTRSVMFRGNNGFWGSWAVEDVSVWSALGNVPPPVTPTPTPTASPTHVSTSTSTAVPPSPTVTATPAPTDTPMPTATPTPTPLPPCEVNVRIDGVERGWVPC
jgi:hypothetical protein